MLKRLKPYLLAFLSGCSMLRMAIDYANRWRGYKAFGGEYFIPFIFMLFVYIWRTWKSINKKSASAATDTD